jgi:DNA polymerase III alpha subunit
MRQDRHGQIILTERDLCNLYLQNPERAIADCLVEKTIKVDPELELSNIPEFYTYAVDSLTLAQFDKQKQQNWYMPDEYKNLDIAQWLLDQCTCETETQRVGQELLLYMDRNMLPLLQYLKYLVDTMRLNKIVWGVGRGSSVASFVLYLIGVHKINSIQYSLDINEFLR